jgi:hypothetical protein
MITVSGSYLGIPLIYSLCDSRLEADSDVKYTDTVFLHYMPVYNLLIGPDLFSKDLLTFFRSSFLFTVRYTFVLTGCLFSICYNASSHDLQDLRQLRGFLSKVCPSSLQLLGSVEFAIDHILIFILDALNVALILSRNHKLLKNFNQVPSSLGLPITMRIMMYRDVYLPVPYY